MARLADDVPLFPYQSGALKVSYIGGRRVVKQQKKIWDELRETRMCPYQVLIETSNHETGLFLSLPQQTITKKEDERTAEETAQKQEWERVNGKLLAQLERLVTRGGSRWAQGGQSMVGSHMCACATERAAPGERQGEEPQLTHVRSRVVCVRALSV